MYRAGLAQYRYFEEARVDGFGKIRDLFELKDQVLAATTVLIAQ